MKTKTVYVLTLGNKSSCFFEMFLLSVQSFNLHNPDSAVEVVIDGNSYVRLCNSGWSLPRNVKQTIVDVPKEWENYRSRYLKTKLRSLVEGDYLYLDVDTLISGSLEQIDHLTADIAAVPDGNGPLGLWNENEADLCRRAGISLPAGTPYFNSGVMYVKDVKAAHILYDLWHTIWRTMVARGIGRDQMALLAANEKQGYPICELSGIWNCQICSSAAIHYFRNARIIHYYTNISGFTERFVKPHVVNGRLDKAALELAADPLEKGRRLYYAEHGCFAGLWSEVLYLFRDNPRGFKFLKSVPGKIARIWK